MNRKSKALGATALAGWCAVSLWAGSHSISGEPVSSTGTVGMWQHVENVQEDVQTTPWVRWASTHDTPAVLKVEEKIAKEKEEAKKKEREEQEAKKAEKALQEHSEAPKEESGTPGTAPAPEKEEEPSGPSTLSISGAVDCSGNPQPCIDAGNLTYYSGCWANGECSQLIGGHDYMGFAYLNSVPVGTVVTVTGPGAGTYEVYDHMWINRQGGDMPAFGGASLVLQSCSGSGTGFSLLRKV